MLIAAGDSMSWVWLRMVPNSQGKAASAWGWISAGPRHLKKKVTSVTEEHSWIPRLRWKCRVWKDAQNTKGPRRAWCVLSRHMRTWVCRPKENGRKGNPEIRNGDYLNAKKEYNPQWGEKRQKSCSRELGVPAVVSDQVQPWGRPAAWITCPCWNADCLGDKAAPGCHPHYRRQTTQNPILKVSHQSPFWNKIGYE